MKEFTLRIAGEMTSMWAHLIDADKQTGYATVQAAARNPQTMDYKSYATPRTGGSPYRIWRDGQIYLVESAAKKLTIETVINGIWALQRHTGLDIGFTMTSIQVNDFIRGPRDIAETPVAKEFMAPEKQVNEDEAFNAGQKAYLMHQAVTDNPHHMRSPLYDSWYAGYESQRRQHETDI